MGACLAGYSGMADSSVILLKVYIQSVAVFPFKGDTHGPIRRGAKHWSRRCERVKAIGSSLLRNSLLKGGQKGP